MNPETGRSPSLMAELKASTSVAHGALDQAPFFQALVARALPLESYVGQLRALAVIHAALEDACAAARDARIKAVWSDDMRKVPLLQQDLRHFEPHAVPDLSRAVNAAVENSLMIPRA